MDGEEIIEIIGGEEMGLKERSKYMKRITKAFIMIMICISSRKLSKNQIKIFQSAALRGDDYFRVHE